MKKRNASLTKAQEQLMEQIQEDIYGLMFHQAGMDALMKCGKPMGFIAKPLREATKKLFLDYQKLADELNKN